MKKRTLVILAVVAALAAVPFVYAGARAHMGREGHGGPGMHGMHGGFGGGFGAGMAFGRHLEHLRSELDLTDQQAAQIREIVASTREENTQYREQLHGVYRNVAQTLIANPSNVAAAQALLDQQAAAERAMKANLLESASKALAVLTPEQRTKLQTLLAGHFERWENRRR